MAKADVLTLREDGTVLAVIKGEDYVLRRPNIGEFRKIRELLNLEEEEKTDDKGDQLLKNIDRNFDWVNEVITMLSDKQPSFTKDEAPLWLANGGLGNDFVTHWLSVPLAPSQAASPARAAR